MSKETEQKGMKMKELTEATGVPKSAILFYFSLGLLPEPVKTGRNMAYYDPTCVERISFIRKTQETYAFPLEKIKGLLEMRDRGEDVGSLIELGSIIFGAGDGERLSRAQFIKETGLSASELKKLSEAGLLLPLGKGTFDAADVRAGRIFKDAIGNGTALSDLSVYRAAALMIVDMEMRVRNERTGSLPAREKAAVTGKMVQAARFMRSYVVDRTFKQRIAGLGGLKEDCR